MCNALVPTSTFQIQILKEGVHLGDEIFDNCFNVFNKITLYTISDNGLNSSHVFYDIIIYYILKNK